jgi:hypothetical protein
MSVTDEQSFLPINPFAEPTTITMSSTNPIPHAGDDDMIDIDFQNATNDKLNSKFNNNNKSEIFILNE